MEIQERMDRLERSARRWRCGFGAMAIGCVALVAFGATAGKQFYADEINCRQLFVRDSKGNQAIGLMTTDDQPGMKMIGKNFSIILTVDDNLATFQLYGKDKKIRALLSADNDISSMMLYDTNGKMKLHCMGNAPHGEVVIFDNKEDIFWRAGVDSVTEKLRPSQSSSPRR